MQAHPQRRSSFDWKNNFVPTPGCSPPRHARRRGRVGYSVAAL